MKLAITYGDPIKSVNLWLFILTLLLLGLWIPSLIEKLTDFPMFMFAMMGQYFPIWFNKTLIGVLPIAEGLIIGLLLKPRKNLLGMCISFLLMLGFTGYVGVAALSDWVKIPCGCMKLISNMSWLGHFFFNLSFLILSGVGIILSKIQRGRANRDGLAEGGSAKRLDIQQTV